MTRYIVPLALAAVLAAVYPWFRKRQLLPQSLLDRILPGRFSDLTAYLEDSEETSPCHEFWCLSDGLRGVISRLADMTLIVRLLQQQVRAGHVSMSDARYVWCKATEQVWFSILSIPEAAVCCLWRKLPHACGLFALRSHYEFTLRAFTVCATEDADIDIARLL